ncbi:hypothetical protein HII28_19560 [Planctomonas sp. JC2975]|uniref:hypothetical protein n=1 Tax=Planctomonas sp. JC2975 TaxID=2729626 RepID=UPI0014735B6A|nr:hypothetical protein [Planctomonas sp. JC2975]NNC14061.1 hypothetical protein [Planctomonas sp. JC2975]
MMSTDYVQMTAHELDVFASGYLEAMTDQAAELERLRAEISRLDREAQQARADAEAAYRQAFGVQAGRTASAHAIRSADIMRARAQHDQRGQ